MHAEWLTVLTFLSLTSSHVSVVHATPSERLGGLPALQPVPFWQGMPYNDDQRRLNQALAKHLREGTAPISTALFVDKRMRCACVLEVLLPWYQAKGWGIVQGVL